jgi:hypothetical protein
MSSRAVPVRGSFEAGVAEPQQPELVPRPALGAAPAST